MQLIQQEATQCGYDFQNGFPYRLTRSDMRFPALWMEPPILTLVNGRKEGVITYHVTLHLLASGKKCSESEKESQWEKLEKQLLEWTQNLILQPEVFSIDKISCTPAEFTLTNQREISLKAEFNIQFAFPHDFTASDPDGESNP